MPLRLFSHWLYPPAIAMIGSVLANTENFLPALDHHPTFCPVKAFPHSSVSLHWKPLRCPAWWCLCAQIEQLHEAPWCVKSVHDHIEPLQQQHMMHHYFLLYTNGELFWRGEHRASRTALFSPALSHITALSRPINTFLSIHSSWPLPLYSPFHLIDEAHDSFHKRKRERA